MNAYLIGKPGTEFEGRLIYFFNGGDYGGENPVQDGPTGVRTVEVESLGADDHTIGTAVVLIYGRDDGVWSLTN